MVHNKPVLWLSDIAEEDKPIAGEKGTHLGILTRNGLPIAPGFVITSDAYVSFLRENNLVKKINQLLTSLNRERPESLMQVSSHIKKIINESPFPKMIAETLASAYD